MGTRKPAATPLAAVLGRGDLASSLLFIFPLFLVYGVGVAFAPAMNGVDFVSKNLFAVVGYSRKWYLLVYLGLAVGFFVSLAILKRHKTFDARRFLPMLLETAIYALTIGTLIIFVMRKLGLSPELAVPAIPLATKEGGVALNLLLSIGAGVHEELVFRLGLLSGGAALLRVFGLQHTPAMLVAVLVSSTLFSAAHHVGAMGDPFTWHVFVYRLLAGVVFAAIYYFRSLAHAVYAHALYDVYVLVLR